MHRGSGRWPIRSRRRLYEFVCAQPAAVSREQAAVALEIPLHQAKFHLDKLEAEGLLDTDYARLSGRTGPGAGRTSKLYRRAARDIAVSLPDREYQLAGRLMADAIAESAASGTPVIDALHRVAHAHGRSLGDSAVAEGDPPARRPLPRWRSPSTSLATTATSLDATTVASSWQLPVSRAGSNADRTGLPDEPRPDRRRHRSAWAAPPDRRTRTCP